MLKALELVGFKSFADKTRFEFPPGISVVVGPNGSGKSNIVDAIKWVLGEQSVKTLRGKEMADVIFNGSATRRGLNAAETTVTFDNSRGLLPIDAAEVHVTRRVYRSGEGEYLINRQPCRLRDIRELFWGTGVATEAYSVIEQGKVDVLLQSSPRDRRMIFEEAAGISRFKIKKIESLRRLERVDQNLLRLSDIVSEVDSRLRSVRLQAAKARRYKEHADRLQELRTQVGLADWRKLGEKLSAIEAEGAAIGQEIAAAAAQAEVMETRALELDGEIAEVDQAIRTGDARITANRERIAALESAIDHERARGRELDEETLRHRRQVSALSVRVGDLAQQLRDTDAEVATAEARHRDVRGKLADDERALTQLTAELDQVRDTGEQRRAEHVARMRAAAAIANETGALESQVEAAQAARARCERRRGELNASRDVLARELEQLRQRQRQLSQALDERAAQLQAGQTQLTEGRRQLTSRQKELAEWRQRHAGAVERTRVLEELERRLEGVGTGVKDVLTRAKAVSSGPLRHVRGIVADLFNVAVETAPLVEVALGEKAQYLVALTHRDLLDHLAAEAPRLSGRVGVVWLSDDVRNSGEKIDLTGQPGVIGRADKFVETSGEFAPLAERLLGRTWFVEKFSHAAALAQKHAGQGLNFVTLAGEHLTADGTLAVGPRHASTGLISRRSELRAIKQQIAEMEAKINQHEEGVAAIERQLAETDVQLLEKAAAHRQAADALAEQRLKVGAAEERRTQVEEQIAALEAEAQQSQQRWETATQALAAVQARLAPIEAGLAALQSQIDDDGRRLTALEERRQKLVRETTAAQVELAKSEQRLADLRSLKRQYERDQQERHRAVSDQEQQLAQALARNAEIQRGILAAESEIAELYLRKESFAGETIALVNRREEYRQERTTQSQAAQKIRSKNRKLEERLHAKELAAGEVRHERTGLADRLREDYGIELAQLDEQLNAAELEAREMVEEEIAELRRKLTNIGGVNLDSLQEADDLEKRFESLNTQFKDLTGAKTSLEQIIDKINTDSRRLFAETFEAVREHFQGLFRKLFGGGQADIVLEEGVDILDSGIEIVARPPGKELRNISLMSGGEKTMTCVALLLAIFRSRPSPFCVLDEVDAALDEANIERFVHVLTEFLDWTQFIVVTHSKKTMMCAHTLYGVTMQESGVSKRVSVRFEDVSDNGEIKPSAAAGDEAA